MQLDDNILRRCKQVIEQLQDDLTRKTVDNKRKDEQIQNLINDRNQVHLKNQQLQKLMYELKEVNVVLRAQLRKIESNDLLQVELDKLQKELNQTVMQLENKSIFIRELEHKLKEQTENKKDIDKQLSLAMRDIMTRIDMLEEEVRLKDEENKKLEKALSSRKCQYCEAISEIKTLTNLRKRIDENLRSNGKMNDENNLKTASSKKSTSLLRELSDKKSSGNIVNNMKSRVRPADSQIIPPFVLNERSNIMMLPTQNTILMRNNYSINQQAVNDTLRQIEEKLQRMSQKLADNEDSDMSMISTR